MSGSVLQLGVSLMTTPLYIHRIGTDRFGILAIVWIFIGYFGLFDMGLGQATNSLVAKLRQRRSRSSLVWTALGVNAGFGTIAASIIIAASGVYLAHAHLSPKIYMELRNTGPWLGAAVVVGVLSSVVSGAVAGRESFLALNIVSTAGTLGFTVVPLITAFVLGPDLRFLIPAAILSRVVGSIPLMVVAWKVVPLDRPVFHRRWLKPLFGFGGWITLSNLVSPILTTLDRVVIASISGATAVTFYTVPYNLATRVLVIPNALFSAIFPRFSKLKRDEIEALARQALLTLNALMTPLVVFGIFIMKGFLVRWIGPDIAKAAAPVGQIILAGAWLNGMAYIPSAVLIGMRRPDIPARLHLLELAPFIGVLALFLHFGGVSGAAWAWTFRVGLDFVLLLAFSRLSFRSYGRLIPSGVLVLSSSALAPYLETLRMGSGAGGVLALICALGLAYASAPNSVKLKITNVMRAGRLLSGEKS